MPALVLGGTVTALGAIRSPAPSASSLRDLPTGRRRGAVPLDTRIERWARGIFHARQLADYLSRVPFERMVLIPCSDTWAETVASLPPELGERFPSFLSTHTVLRRLTKETFASLVHQLEIPHPQTLFVHSVSDLDGVSLTPGTQFFLKARNSQKFIAKTGVKAYMVASPEQIRIRVGELSVAGLGVVLQEYIPGPPTNHYFVDGFTDGNGAILARFARQRLRMYPPHFGNSTFLRSVALPTSPISSRRWTGSSPAAACAASSASS